MRISTIIILFALAACAAAAENKEVTEAINYVSELLPNSNSDTWQSKLVNAVAAMKQHPVYSKWIQQDEAAAAGRSSSSSSSKSPQFSCDLPKSASVPQSVHKLRPADVNVIAAMGDSLTAASGAKANNILGLLTEYRGYAWSIGGQKQLKEHTTLANILREGNNQLYGQSLASGSVHSFNTKLNVAEPGKKAADMLGQAKRLVSKLNSDKYVDFDNDWKVITLFIGGNDICDYCDDKNRYSTTNYIKHIKEALDYLYLKVPRAFVNVAEVLDVALVGELKDGSRTCQVLLGSLLCKCAAYPQNEAEAQEIQRVVREYQAALRDLVASGRYDTREDFTVVNQPFYRNSSPPRINGKFDFSFFAPDCFHFSHRGHDNAAKSLWNNMLEPVGKKSDKWNPDGDFLCPTSARPYLMTSKNS